MEGFAYQASSRSEVHGCLPGQATRVLDVGCNDGSFGVFLRTLYPGAIIWGVEPNTNQAALASERLDRVLMDYFDPQMQELKGMGGFDLITFNHVLEHMYDPWSVLAQSRELLKSGGVIAGVIPNIRYMPFLVSLGLRGKWDYQDSGLLDRTHIRFFTRDSISQMVSAAGLRLERLDPVNAMGEVRFKQASRLASRVLGDLAYGGFALKASARS